MSESTSGEPIHRNAFGSRVPTTDIFGKHLSLAVTCQVVGTAHMHKYWPLVRFPPTADKCDTGQRNRQCLFINRYLLLLSHGSFTLDKQTSDLCVECIFRYVECPSNTSRGQAVKMTKKTLASITTTTIQ